MVTLPRIALALLLVSGTWAAAGGGPDEPPAASPPPAAGDAPERSAADAGHADPARARQVASPCERVARRVQRRYEAIRTLAARFEQSSRLASLAEGGGAAGVSRGTVRLAKPGKMRWSYEEPEPSLVVSDGVTVWTYDPTLAEAQRFAVTDGLLEGAAVQFLLGRGDILESFAVTGASCDSDAARLILTPRRDASYQRLEIAVETASGRIDETTVFDLFGNVTRVAFSEIRTDVELPPETFVFTPPPGVSVLDVGSSTR